MERLFVSCRFTIALAICLLSAARTGSVAIVFDDHFTGNSGGVPVGWSVFLPEGPGSVVETGTTVTLYDDVGILSSFPMDPSGGTVAITTYIAATNAEYGADTFVSSPDLSSYFGTALYVSNGQIEVVAADTEGGEQRYIAGYLNGYTGGGIQVTTVIEALTFSISTDTPAYSSGPIPYATAFASFTREDLGSIVHLSLGNGAGVGGPADSTSFDRVTVDVAPPVEVEGMSFGQVKKLYGR